MKHIIAFKALLAGASLFASLTAQAQAVNNNKADKIDYDKEITQDQYNASYKALRVQIGQALSGLYGLRGGKNGDMPGPHAYQFEFSLGPDNYCQYSCVPHSDFPYSDFTLRSTYDLCKGSLSGPKAGYDYVRQGVVPILNDDNIDNIPELKAAYLLFYDYAALESADLFGPEPYTDFKNDRDASPFTYQDLRTIYYTVEANIRDIVACLKHFDSRPDWYKKNLNGLFNGQLPFLKDYDYQRQGMDVFVRFANSLKLRMAIHISSVEPETAKRWAEEAVAGGVIEQASDEIALFTSMLGFAHPLIQVSEWGDSRLSASFESLLMSLDHPYAKYLFLVNSDPITKSGSEGSAPAMTQPDTRLVGMRDGTVPGVGQAVGANPYIAFSKLDNNYLGEMMPPCYVMKLSEVRFLRAEGALRGWDMGGTAQQFYEDGIRNAFLEDRDMDDIKYNDYVDDYMNLAQPIDYTYVDPTGNTPDMPSVTKIGVKWDDNLDRETKLEMIITQKYIASFPYSFEPWVDLRRTGYPKLFPVLNVADGDGSLKQGEQMRRIPWASDDPQTISDLNATGIPALGGPDQMATRLWWDTGVNFPAVDAISAVGAGKALATVRVDGQGQVFVEGADHAWVYDAAGRLVSEAVQPSAMRLPRGFYVVRTRSGQQTQSWKVVVE